MSYPRIYNAAVDMVDRNVAEGRASKPVFIDPNETLTYGELAARCNRMANLLATYAIPREARVALLLLDTVDFPVAFWGAIKAGVVPVALNTLLTTEQYAYILGDSRAKALFVSAPLLPVVQPILGTAAVPQARVRLGRRGAAVRAVVARRAAAPGAGLRDRRHLQRRDGLLALLVRLDRHAQRRAPRALEPDGDGAAVRTGLPRHPRGRSRLFGGQAVLRLRSRQRHVVSDVGRRHQRAAAGSADAGAGVPHAEAAPADRILRRADAVRGDAGLSRRARRTTAPSACACASRPARRCRPRSARPSATSSASTYWTASAPPRCCISTSATARARCATAPPASPSPATKSAWSTSRARTSPDGEVGEMLVRGTSAAEGYWNQRDKSRSTFEGGWTRSGDKYIRDADGYYTYQGRTDDMFKVSGIWVSPFEVESALVEPRGGARSRRGAARGHRRAAEADGLHRAEARQDAPATACRRPSRSTSRRRPAPGNIRAGSSSSTACRRRRPARSSASSCARHA